MKAQAGVEVQLYSFFNLGARGPLYPRERDPVPVLQGAGWAPGQVWTGAENFAPPPLGFEPEPSRA